MALTLVPQPGPRRQTCRYLKAVCDACGWTARVTAKHILGRDLRCPEKYCEGSLELHAKGKSE